MTGTPFQKKQLFNIRKDFLICLFLVLSILAVYWQVRNHDFVNYDDTLYVSNNPHIRTGLTTEGIIWALTTGYAANWHPLTWISHMVDCQIYGLNSGQHHMTNVLFHILNTLLLFFVFKRMTGELWQSSFVAALFALHPLHVESVAWVAERKDLLSTFFLLLTLWGYVRYVERSNLGRYLLVLLFFILGLMAKPMLVTLPFMLLLLDYWPLNRFQVKESGNGNTSKQRRAPLFLIFEKLPMFFLSSISCVVTYFVQKNSGAVSLLDAITFKVRFANAMVSYGSYIRKMIWPNDLACIYPYIKIISEWKVAWAWIILVIMFSFSMVTIRKKPYIAVGWFWFIGVLVPVIGIVQVGFQAMADRYTYVPIIGLFIIVAWGVSDMLSGWRYKRITLAISSLLVLSAFMFCTWRQVRNWQNSITLFENAIHVTPNNYVAHHKLGEALVIHGKNDEAMKHYLEALRIKPDFIPAHLNMGVVLSDMGNVNKAIDQFSTVLNFKPDCAEAHYELGVSFKKKGDIEAALQHFYEALRLKPEDARTHNNLGVVHIYHNNIKKAIFHFYEAIRIDSSYAGAYYNLGKIFYDQGNTRKAILFYQKSLDSNPDMIQALYNLSLIFSCNKEQKYRDSGKAMNLAEKLCKINQYNEPLSLDALAAAYAEKGKFDDAVSTVEKALNLAIHNGPKTLVSDLKKRLQLYRKGEACR